MLYYHIVLCCTIILCYAVLLYCAVLDIVCLLLQGYDGQTVVHRPEQSYAWNELQLRLWNPLSGGVVSVKDVTGELREVSDVG
jgi:hypothetical protein